MLNKKIVILFILTIFIIVGMIYWLMPQDNNVDALSLPLSSKKSLEHAETLKQDEQKQEIGNKVNFDKFVPNPIWKDKFLNIHGKHLHYKFGAGNPLETALAQEDYLAKGENDGIPYVTSDTEHKLQEFLSDRDLPAILDKCENYNRKEMVRLNPNIPVNQIPILLQPSYFDIENILVIDLETGRKEINQPIINQMNEFFNLLNNPLSGSEFSDQCIGIAYSESIQRIQNKFSDFTKSYINTGESLPSSVWLK